MEIKVAPSLAQSLKDPLFGHDNNDIAVFSTGSFTSHLETLRSAPSVLSTESFRINLSKCIFAVTQVVGIMVLGH